MGRRKKDKKISNFVDKPNKEFEIYRNGAIVGALIGGITGLIIRKKIIFCTLIGAVVGGYVAYETNSNDTGLPSFKKFLKS